MNDLTVGLQPSLIITSAPSAISFRDRSDKPRVVLGTMLVKPIPRSRSLWSSTALIGSVRIPDKYRACQKRAFRVNYLNLGTGRIKTLIGVFISQNVAKTEA